MPSRIPAAPEKKKLYRRMLREAAIAGEGFSAEGKRVKGGDDPQFLMTQAGYKVGRYARKARSSRRA